MDHPTLGAYPSLAIGPLLDSHKHDIAAMLRESLATDGADLLRKRGDVPQRRQTPRK